MPATAFKAIVAGRVQGVYYRSFAQQHAYALGITGYARNLADGSVEVVAEGEQVALETFIGYLHTGPRAAEIEKIEVTWQKAKGSYRGFQIRG
jgi:acylphosphatase